MGADLWTILVAALLIPLAGVFAALDSGLNTVSVARVDELAKEGRGGAERLARVVRVRARYVNLLVLLHMMCLAGAAALLAGVFSDRFGGHVLGPLAAVGVTVVAGYIVAGVGPRTIGRQHAYSLSLGAAWPLTVLGTVLGPVSRLLIVIGNAITPGRGFRNGPFASEIELLEIVEAARERGVVAEDESRMIQSVFELGDTTTREIMTPRTEMVWIEGDKTVSQACRLAVLSGHSRIPVIGENVDEVLGVVYLRDLVATQLEAGGGEASLTEVLREVEFVPDSKNIDGLLAEMQRHRYHLAILVDEYGGIAGLVTIEDILEEIVGEIVDEHDDRELAPHEDLGGGQHRLSARLALDEVAEIMHVEFPDEITEEVDTLAGLLALELGRVPLPGARVRTCGLDLVAERGIDGRGRIRVMTVLAGRTDGAGGDGNPRSGAGSRRIEETAADPSGERTGEKEHA